MIGLETQQASLQTLLCLHESIGNMLVSLDETIVPTDHTDTNPNPSSKINHQQRK